MQKIDKFFVLDFDRCIGNIDGSFDILMDVVHELSILDRQIFKSIRDKTELLGNTFSALEYLDNHYPLIDLDTIENLYIARAQNKPSSLLEPGAKEFLDFLHTTDRKFCIMSFGDERWQTTKITGAGIKNAPIIIVPNIQKSDYIRKWLNPISAKFIIPKEYFTDNKPKEVSEIVLVDDKVTAFWDLPPGVKGYLVLGSSTTITKQQLSKIPPSVEQIIRIDEIIGHESLICK